MSTSEEEEITNKPVDNRRKENDDEWEYDDDNNANKNTKNKYINCNVRCVVMNDNSKATSSSSALASYSSSLSTNNKFNVVDGQVLGFLPSNKDNVLGGRIPDLWKIQLNDGTATTTTSNEYDDTTTNSEPMVTTTDNNTNEGDTNDQAEETDAAATVSTKQIITKDVTLDELKPIIDLSTKRVGSSTFPNLIQQQDEITSKFERVIKERQDKAIVDYIETSILPKLCVLATMEEKLYNILQQKQNSASTSSATTETRSAAATTTGINDYDQPKYYMMTPNSYMQPPTPITQLDSINSGTGAGAGAEQGIGGEGEEECQGYTPQIIGQRIRHGVQLAWQYYSEKERQRKASLPDSNAGALGAGMRRSTRVQYSTSAAASSSNATMKPQPIQKGGRIALYLLDLLEQEQNDSNEEEEDENDKENDDNNCGQNEKVDRKEEDMDEEEEDEEEEEEEDEESDDDEDEEDDDDDDDEIDLSDNMYLQPSIDQIIEWLGRKGRSMTGYDIQHGICNALPGINDEDDDIGLSLFEESDDVKLSLDDVYLKPLLRKAKNKLNPDKSKTALLASLAQQQGQVLIVDGKPIEGDDKEAGRDSNDNNNNEEDNDEDHNYRIVLECTSGDKERDLPQFEVNSFGRCKFTLAIHKVEDEEEDKDDEEIAVGSSPSKKIKGGGRKGRKPDSEAKKEAKRLEKQLIQQKQQQIDRKYKEKKAWHNYRYKSIHGGYATWPSWSKFYVQSLWPKQKQINLQLMDAVSASASTSATTASVLAREQQQATTTTTSSTIESDVALAKSLAEQEEESSSTDKYSRRSRRGVGKGDNGSGNVDGISSSGVFYGSQANMTQQQLLDTVFRLLCTPNQPQTLMSLNSLVAEETTNPLYRLRCQLGRLLWKRNQQISRWDVSSKQSDYTLLKNLLVHNRPLLDIDIYYYYHTITSDRRYTDSKMLMSAADQQEEGEEQTTTAMKEEKEQTKQITNGNNGSALSQEPKVDEEQHPKDVKVDNSEEVLDTVPDTSLKYDDAVPPATTTSATAIVSDAIVEKQNGAVATASNIKEEEGITGSKGNDINTNDEAFLTIKKQIYSLTSYIKSLHQTELLLRQIVLSRLASKSINIIASAADERLGSLEAMDMGDFGMKNNEEAEEEEEEDDIEWQTSGHALLRKVIFRRPYSTGGDMGEPCRWYKVRDFTPSVLSETPAEPTEGNKQQQPTEVERRIRFRAVPIAASVAMSKDQMDVEGNDDDVDSERMLILTEAQVHAGLKAAEMQRQQSSRKRSTSTGNPLSKNVGSCVTLLPIGTGGISAENQENAIHCTIVGFDTICLPTGDNYSDDANDSDDGKVEHRILILPDVEDNDASKEEKTDDSNNQSTNAFWAAVVDDGEGNLTCAPLNQTGVTARYRIGQSDYNPTSDAFQECKKLVTFLGNHNKAGIFLEPVDPVALNIPDYFDVIKHPMDISTLSKNLERGLYSKVPATNEEGWTTPIAKMLNGPFRDDLCLIFDNAMKYNVPPDWIYAAADSLKKLALRKIESASYAAEGKSASGGADSSARRGGGRQKKSIYVDEDSDVDMYEYESDHDDEFELSNRRKRKRKQKQKGINKRDDPSTRAIEEPIRLQSILSETKIGGPLADLPINNDPSLYTLPEDWSCRHKVEECETTNDEEDVAASAARKQNEEMIALLSLQRAMEENERASLRRSTRAQQSDDYGSSNANDTKNNSLVTNGSIEYYISEEVVPSYDDEVEDELASRRNASSRIEIESSREFMHELYYAKLYRKYSSHLLSNLDSEEDEQQQLGSKEEKYGLYANDSFPPYLGRVVPSPNSDNIVWEIRSSYAVPALRWVIRGLVQSGHIGEIEPLMLTDAPMSTGVIMPNNVYYHDASLTPFDVLDIKELQRRKRADTSGHGDEDSEDDIELSEYEKMRAERVARNAERLKALGLT